MVVTEKVVAGCKRRLQALFHRTLKRIDLCQKGVAASRVKPVMDINYR